MAVTRLDILIAAVYEDVIYSDFTVVRALKALVLGPLGKPLRVLKILEQVVLVVIFCHLGPGCVNLGLGFKA